MAAPAQPIESPFRRRARGLGRAVGPIGEARGFPRVMLYIGAAITLFFVLLALLAPLISPYDFDQYQSERPPVPAARSAVVRTTWMGTTVQSTDVMSRVIWGAQTELKVVFISLVLLDHARRPARAPLRLLRRQARPGARPRHGRAVRVPVPPARDRDRVPARRTSIGQGILTAAIAITVVYVPAVLPRGPQPRDRAPGGVVRRGGARARREAAARSSASTSSSTSSRTSRRSRR